MKVDYIIVGAGIAGLAMAQYLLKNNKSFIVFDNECRTSSKVAGGMFNPVVLKRFTSIWESQPQIDIANSFYPELEEKLSSKFYHTLPIYRKFASVEEQNNWFLACDNPVTAPFLNDQLYKEQFNGIKSNYYFGEVYKTGFLDVKKYVEVFQTYLKKSGLLITVSFDYALLNHNENGVVYKDIKAGKIVFAEGFSIHQNPYFNYLPVDGTKGELLYVRIPNLKLKAIVKSGVFIIPMENDIYKVGATYNWQDKSDERTKEAREELIEGLESLINVPYEIVDHLAGIRPTVKDRRPLIGSHYQYRNMYLLNGLGTRGVLLGPYLADKLFQYIENNVPLDHNVDVKRYYKKLQLIK